MVTNTIFFHGWGYNTLFWQNHIQNYTDTSILLYNRGYFGAYYKPLLKKGKNRCVTHSTGLFFAVQEYDLSEFDDIIIYAGFDVFPNKTASKAMRLGMMQNKNNQFDTILKNFHSACGFIPSFTDIPNKEKLIDDLKMLETFNITNELNKVVYTAYHGTDDKIVSTPLEKAKIIANAGHLCNLI